MGTDTPGLELLIRAGAAKWLADNVPNKAEPESTPAKSGGRGPDKVPRKQPRQRWRRIRSGSRKLRLLTLDSMDRRTRSYKRIMARVKEIEQDEFAGDPTPAQHQCALNDALLAAVTENLAVRYFSGEPASPRRLTELVAAQRGERRSRNE
jgi:hypothetical protein